MAVVVGSAALAFGVASCFQGLRLLPYVVPIGALLAGAALGAETVSILYGIPLLSTGPSMIVALVVGLIFAALSHAHYHSTIIAMAGLAGFVLGSVWLTASGHAAVGFPGGFALAVVFAMAAAFLPRALFVLVTAAMGGLLAVVGMLLIGGWVSIDDRGVATILHAPRAWALGWGGITALGAAVQVLTMPGGKASGS